LRRRKRKKPARLQHLRPSLCHQLRCSMPTVWIPPGGVLPLLREPVHAALTSDLAPFPARRTRISAFSRPTARIRTAPATGSEQQPGPRLRRVVLPRHAGLRARLHRLSDLPLRRHLVGSTPVQRRHETAESLSRCCPGKPSRGRLVPPSPCLTLWPRTCPTPREARCDPRETATKGVGAAVVDRVERPTGAPVGGVGHPADGPVPLQPSTSTVTLRAETPSRSRSVDMICGRPRRSRG
jgi:hypothetical protein